MVEIIGETLNGVSGVVDGRMNKMGDGLKEIQRKYDFSAYNKLNSL